MQHVKEFSHESPATCKGILATYRFTRKLCNILAPRTASSCNMHMQNAKVFLRHPDVLPSWRGLQPFDCGHAHRPDAPMSMRPDTRRTPWSAAAPRARRAQQLHVGTARVQPPVRLLRAAKIFACPSRRNIQMAQAAELTSMHQASAACQLAASPHPQALASYSSRSSGSASSPNPGPFRSLARSRGRRGRSGGHPETTPLPAGEEAAGGDAKPPPDL